MTKKRLFLYLLCRRWRWRILEFFTAIPSLWSSQKCERTEPQQIWNEESSELSPSPLFINKRAKASIRPKDTRRFNLNRCANPTVPTQKIQRIKIPPHKNETLLRSNDQGASSWNEVVMPLC
jgi:hypothetical protein